MAITLGLACKFYRNTGSPSSPTWTVIDNVTDVTMSLSTDIADVTTRGAAGWKAQVPTLKDGTISFEMIADKSDANYTALFNAFLNNTSLDCAAADGPIATTGTTYFRALFSISKFEITEALTDARRASVELVPTYSATQAPGFTTAP